MFKNLLILSVLATIVALPFIFRQEAPAGDWRKGDPQLVIVSPHNEAIRFEFEQGFSKWHKQKYGQPVKIDWRSIGGTTEISRYLLAAYTASVRGWWERQGSEWPDGATETLTASKPPGPTKDGKPPAKVLVELFNKYREIDSPTEFSADIDLYFGGGEYDHSDMFARGVTVPVWRPDQFPAGLFTTADGSELIPERNSGELWRTRSMFGTAVSTFGICYNVDRLRDLGVATPPKNWSDLANPVYFRQVGVADPTKSGSIAKAFEMIVHQKIHERVIENGFSDEEIARLEKFITATKWSTGQNAADFPRIEVYQRSIESGWVDGIRLLQQIGANARYFTDAASKVAVDVSIGDAAVGMSIDFYGRFQAQNSFGPNGEVRMEYVTPVGGTSVSCDPVGLLRGAPHRELATRFIEFCLSEEGQRLWTYKPGEPGGPTKFALRRLPIRRDFYPSTNPAMQRTASVHASRAADPLGDPTVDPYEVAKHFTYYPRWTGSHFGVQRSIIRAMCMDSADELKAAWATIRTHGGPLACPQAMEKLGQLPTVTLTKDGQPVQVPLTWQTAPTFSKLYDPLEYMREWTAAFRANYSEAKRLGDEGK